MLLNLIPIGLGLVIGLTTGGKLGNLAHLRVRWVWVVFAAFIVREAIVFRPLNRVDGVQYVYVASEILLIAWTIFHIRYVPAIWVVTAGSALNLIVVLANGGFMPVLANHPGVFAGGHVGQYILMGPSTNLNWLGDWINIPGPLGGSGSPGDVVIAIGIGIVLLLGTVNEPGETSRRIVSDPP
ncbi:MAG: DUF5317 family protein [Candidatus Dormibacter sp.]